MNKAFYISGIVLSVIFMMVVSVYAEEVSSARIDYLYSTSLSGYNQYSTAYYPTSYPEDYTREAGLISIFFILFFITADLLGLLKVKTKTTKVLSIIGLSVGGLFLFWDILVIGSPGAMSFDEVGPGFFFYALIVLAFSIIGLVQSIRYGRSKKKPLVGSDLLDS